MVRVNFSNLKIFHTQKPKMLTENKIIRMTPRYGGFYLI